LELGKGQLGGDGPLLELQAETLFRPRRAFCSLVRRPTASPRDRLARRIWLSQLACEAARFISVIFRVNLAMAAEAAMA
jgi:hypothetical protein